MNRYPVHILIFLAISLLAASCSPALDQALASEAIQAGTLPGEVPASNAEAIPTEPAVINPLTGLPVSDPLQLERRPVMVKVSNYPRNGRPHAGLSFADLVFDYYIGSGTNRFLAVYYGQDSQSIGPVRSGRRVDAQLVTMYSGILGYGSADESTDEELITHLGSYAISHLEAPFPAFCGKDTHDATGVFANSAAISDYVDSIGLDNNKPDLAGMAFDAKTPNGGKYGEKLTVLFNFYNRAEWRYDAATGKYLRWIEYMEDEASGEFEMVPLVDRVTGEQLAFSNVILIFAEYTELAPSAHQIAIWANDKGQPAYFFHDGQVFSGNWRASNDTDPMQFFREDGSAMPLKPGNTWIVIAGLSSTYMEIQPGEWEMFFFLP
jgi:hypothetical protein